MHNYAGQDTEEGGEGEEKKNESLIKTNKKRKR
jgi:hypothetical protein